MTFIIDESKIGKRVKINKEIIVDSGVMRLTNYNGIVKYFASKNDEEYEIIIEVKICAGFVIDVNFTDLKDIKFLK